VVEDDDAVRHACIDALREHDYALLDAPDAMEAFRLISDHGGIDLLLTDLGLPGGVSGHALADAARNVDRRIRVVFTTGYDRAELSGFGAAALLRKPFSAEQLTNAVRDALTAGGSVASQETARG
jgi:CheY-like chemotaxis protein